VAREALTPLKTVFEADQKISTGDADSLNIMERMTLRAAFFPVAMEIEGNAAVIGRFDPVAPFAFFPEYGSNHAA